MIAVLSITAVPPPVHGSNVVNSILNHCLKESPAHDFTHIDYSFVEKISEIGVFRWGKILRLSAVWLEVFHTLRKKRFDVIYFPMVIGRSVVLRDLTVLWLFRRMSKAKVVIHFHSKGWHRHSSLLQRILCRSFRSATLIYLSDSLIEIEASKNHKTVVLPNGIERPLLSPRRNPVPTLGFFSNLLIEKGILIFLDTCEILNESGVSFEARIAGNESPELNFEMLSNEIEQRNLVGRVVVLGPVYGKKKHDFLSSVDVFILPTRYRNECMPLTVIEGMCYGCYLITSDEGALKDMVEHPFGVTEDVNPVSIAGGVLHAHKSGLLSIDEKRSRAELASSRYSIESMKENFLRIINESCVE